MAKTHRIDSNEFKCDKGYCDTIPDSLPELGRLFELMDSGVVPNWLEVWQAISEYVAFSTKDDSWTDLEFADPENMSQKKCRFCV